MHAGEPYRVLKKLRCAEHSTQWMREERDMKVRSIKMLVLPVVVMSLLVAPSALAGPGGPNGSKGSHVTQGTDVKATNDNNNVDGGTPNPGFDAQNRQSNETTVAISPANAAIVAAGANDYRMVTVTGDVWFGLYVSNDNGATWFNTFVPGFPSDTCASGLASPLLGLDA